MAFERASCDVSESKSQGDGGDEKEAGDDDKEGEGDDQLVNLFGNSDTSESEAESDEGNPDLCPNGHEWEEIAVVSEDLANLSRHRRTKIHFEHDGLGIAERTILDYVMWSFPTSFVPTILAGTNRGLAGKKAAVSREEFWRYIGCVLVMRLFDFGARKIGGPLIQNKRPVSSARISNIVVAFPGTAMMTLWRLSDWGSSRRKKQPLGHHQPPERYMHRSLQ